MIRIAVIIVTYNRKDLLAKCLDAIKKGEMQPSAIYIVDNNSHDGTHDMLQSKGYLNDENIIYINTGENLGGAGGFYTGMKAAHESNKYDAYLLMDDDGCPDKDEIKELAKHIGTYDYINAFVIDIDNHNRMCFGENVNRDKMEQSSNSEGLIVNHADPFNGTMFTKRLVNKVGYVNPDLFIYGDDFNYHNRCIKAGFIPVTCINAIHYHPYFYKKSGNRKHISILGYKFSYTMYDKPILIYCSYRNTIYNIFSFKDFLRVLFKFPMRILLQFYGSRHNGMIALKACWAGITCNLKGHKQYL
ncbi:glycosyltransferase [Phocaeicola salanitronis]|uniref:glycosyltransferase n=1 Tax=Phocaeicola salanitronis TaxID=376805 RepID=UPI0023F93BFD|nr:glycosyltransferase [Phocaeicola salanitronis]